MSSLKLKNKRQKGKLLLEKIILKKEWGSDSQNIIWVFHFKIINLGI